MPFYRVSLSSFPQITVDQYNNIFYIWSAATPGNPDPDLNNYRHLWGRAKYHTASAMTGQIDLNSDFQYIFQEFVYESMAKTPGTITSR